MTRYWFPDNTVLCNFAAVDELAILETFLDGRGRWVEAVAAETAMSARVHQALVDLTWLGDPLEFDDPKTVGAVERIRRAVFGGTPDRATQHLGEAQTCWLLHNDRAYGESVWITDDRQAFDYGKRQGIRTLDTAGLVAEAVARTDLTRTSGWELLARMVDSGRDNVRLPPSPADLD